MSIYSFIDEFYDFTVGSVIRFFLRVSPSRDTNEYIPEHPFTEETEAFAPDSTPEIDWSIEEDQGPETFKPLASILEQREASAENLAHTIAYVGSTRVPLFSAPTKEFDTVRSTVPYGTMVMVLEEKGRFSKVSVNGVEGWVLHDDLADRAAYVYPEFVIGEENDVDAPNTLRLRACIKDEFCGGEAEFPLQAGEYVTYKLLRKGKTIEWPEVRPRTPGRWHSILRGAPGIHIGIVPKVGSIMECTLENDIGHLAYVEAVFPDDRITISEANYPDRGIYNERSLTKEEWQALNPVFIEVN